MNETIRLCAALHGEPRLLDDLTASSSLHTEVRRSSGDNEAIAAPAVVRSVLTHPDTQGLGVDAQITDNLRNRALLLSGYAHGALSELGSVLAASGRRSDFFLEDH